jgi:hypothetical protein
MASDERWAGSGVPAWARQERELLVRRVAELEEMLTAREGEYAGSEVFIEHPILGEINLPPRSRVGFRMGPHYKDRMVFFVPPAVGRQPAKAPRVEVYAGRSLVVEPHVTNVVHLSLRDR